MVIIRDGKEIELTDSELRTAYYELEHKWDCEYIRDRLPDLLDDCEPEYIKKEVENEELISEVAYKWREYIDNRESGDYEWVCLEDAYDYVRY